MVVVSSRGGKGGKGKRGRQHLESRICNVVSSLITSTKDVLNDVNKHISRSCIRWASRHSTWWLPNKWHVALSPDSNADASSTLHSSGFRGKSYIALLGLMRPREPLT